jgi:hypothetical protein
MGTKRFMETFMAQLRVIDMIPQWCMNPVSYLSLKGLHILLQEMYCVCMETQPTLSDLGLCHHFVRISFLFGDVANYFKFIDYKKNLKIGMSAVGKQ